MTIVIWGGKKIRELRTRPSFRLVDSFLWSKYSLMALGTISLDFPKKTLDLLE